MSFNTSFFKKTGIKVARQLERERLGRSEELQDFITDFYEESRNPNRDTSDKIKKVIALYPDEPILYNYLYTCLKIENKVAEAYRTALETHRKFPDYFFAPIMVAEQHLGAGNFEGAQKVLGDAGDIRLFKPNTPVFHESEFMGYYAMAGQIACELNNLDLAKRHLRTLLDWDPKNTGAKILGHCIFKNTALKRLQSLNDKPDLRSIEHIVPEKYPSDTAEPTFVHPESAILMTLDWDKMPSDTIATLSALPRATFIEDLCALLIDSIRRYDYYKAQDMEGSQASHALAWLALLKAEEALPVVLDTLRQSYEYQDYWLGDFSAQYYDWYLSVVAESHLDVFQAFARERNIGAHAKEHIAASICQMALRQPELMPKAVEWFSAWFQYLLDHATDERLIDAELISFYITDASDLRTPELLPLIEQINDQGWIDETVMGDIEEIRETFHLPSDPSDINPIPEHMAEFYDQSYLKRRAKTNRILEAPLIKEDPVVEKYLLGFWKDFLGSSPKSDLYYDDDDWEDDEEAYEIEMRPQPKAIQAVKAPPAPLRVSKNAACPCGSGKKYKRCCGK